MAILNLDDTNFDNEITNGVALVDFYADWCGPCKMIAPIIDQLAQETDAKIIKVNVDIAKETARKYNIMSIPTIIIFKDGNIQEQVTGFVPKEQLLDMINKVK